MKLIFPLVIPLNLVLLTNGLSLVKRDVPAVVEAPIRRQGRTQNPVQNDRIRRDVLHRRQTGDTLQVPLENAIQSYVINIKLGTPAQEIGLHIDTGSSDLWVNVPTSELCVKYGQLCDEFGTFNPKQSSTYTFLNNGFNITYADGSGAAGPYAEDILSIGTAVVPDFEFGVGFQSTTTEAVLGIGYDLNEGGSVTGSAPVYKNLPAKLASNGIINTNAYSLYLDDLAASTGTLLFGGVNAAKYHGNLHTLPINRVYGLYSQLTITMTSFGLNTAGSIASNSQIPVLLDSGTSLTYLPPRIVAAIFREYNLRYNPRTGFAVIPCSASSNPDKFLFTFSGVTISVPFSELVIDAVESSNPAVESSICAFGIAPAVGDSSLFVLGDTFLRSAYVVYDLQLNEISLAQTRFDSSLPDDILEITSAGVPGSGTADPKVTGVPVKGTGALSGGRGSNAAGHGASPSFSFGILGASIGAVAVAMWLL